MVIDLTEARSSKAPDTEKLTINLGVVDLGQIDLLVQEGFYSNLPADLAAATPSQGSRPGPPWPSSR